MKNLEQNHNFLSIKKSRKDNEKMVNCLLPVNSRT